MMTMMNTFRCGPENDIFNQNWVQVLSHLNFLSSSKLEQLSLLELRDRPEADIEILEFRLKLLNMVFAFDSFLSTLDKGKF